MFTDMIEVVIDSIRVNLMSQQRIIILREKNSERYLPIWIGVFEAESIALALQEVEIARPLTHDLMRNLLRELGARVIRVEVVDLNNDTYYGNIVLEAPGEVLNIDARPSDALALAVRTHVPIFVARKVFETAGITPEEDVRTQDIKDTAVQSQKTDIPPVEDERLSIFEEFIEKLDEDEE